MNFPIEKYVFTLDGRKVPLLKVKWREEKAVKKSTDERSDGYGEGNQYGEGH